MTGQHHGEHDLDISPAERQLIENLMYGKESVKRFTQDSPILPDVWMAFFSKPAGRVDLLFTPWRGTAVGMLAKAVRDGVRAERVKESDRADVSYNLATVAAQLSFEELIRVVLPLTKWWRDNVWSSEKVTIDALRDPKQRKVLARAIANPDAEARALGISVDLLWLLRVVGAIARKRTSKAVMKYPDSDKAWLELVNAVAETVGDMDKTAAPSDVSIFNVTRNRRAELTVYRSTLAVKADAALQLFSIKCDRLSWAVVDSGIDARHIAFQRDPKAAAGQDVTDPERLKNTRVKKTYDFTVVRNLLNLDKLENDELPPHLTAALKDKDQKKGIESFIKDLKGRLQRGQEVDWTVLGPLVEIKHKAP